MRQITADQFKAAIEIDPAWASKLTEPVEITDFCDMQGSKITHLSPLLHFTGKNEYDNSAHFCYCESLKIAEGNFSGCVDFSQSAIKEIGNLSCGKNKNGYSAAFFDCNCLKVAEGKFEGFVSFSNSAIERIGNLTCGKNNKGIRLNTQSCPNLKSIPITFNPKEIEADCELFKNLTEVRAFIQKKRTEIVEIVI